MTALDALWVGLGSLMRWWVGRAVGERCRGDFPLRTLLINISGAFPMGYLSVLFAVDWHTRHGTALTALCLTGIIGGCTTFMLMHASIASAVVALVYVAASLLLGYLAVIVGERLGGQARRWVAAGQPGRSMTLDPLLLTPALSARAAKGRDPRGGTVRGNSGGGITYSKAWVV